MKIEKTETPKLVQFAITGSISGMDSNTMQLFDSVFGAIDKKPPAIAFDLALTTSLDSLAIGLLVGILLKCKELGINFRLRNVSPPVQAILESTNLKKVFPELY